MRDENTAEGKRSAQKKKRHASVHTTRPGNSTDLWGEHTAPRKGNCPVYIKTDMHAIRKVVCVTTSKTCSWKTTAWGCIARAPPVEVYFTTAMSRVDKDLTAPPFLPNTHKSSAVAMYVPTCLRTGRAPQHLHKSRETTCRHPTRVCAYVWVHGLGERSTIRTAQIELADVVVPELPSAVSPLVHRDVSFPPHELLQQRPCLVHAGKPDRQETHTRER